MVTTMESFNLNSAKSFIGKNVNLHLKDGAVIVNVHLKNIKKGNFGKGNFIEYTPYGNHRVAAVPLRSVAWAKLLNVNIISIVD